MFSTLNDFKSQTPADTFSKTFDIYSFMYDYKKEVLSDKKLYAYEYMYQSALNILFTYANMFRQRQKS